MTSCFKILGISRGSSVKEIKKAFRKKAKETHPDKFLHPVEKKRATADFHKVYGAYEQALSGAAAWSGWQSEPTPTDDSNTESQDTERSDEKAYRAYKDVSEELDGRVAAIRRELASEHSFHLQEMNSKLRQASTYAHEGNKNMMEFCIKCATKHAQKCNRKDADFSRRVAAIQAGLTSDRSFHLREVNSNLRQAATYAHEGNKNMMEFCIKCATKHAQKCKGKDADFSRRVAAIREKRASKNSSCDSEPYPQPRPFLLAMMVGLGYSFLSFKKR